jgi:hypothetical protein
MVMHFEDLGGDDFAIHYTQDCEPIIETNKYKQNMGREYYAASSDLWRVASVPASVQLKWWLEYGVDIYNEDHRPAVIKLLNDPEWRYLKTAEVVI